MPWTYCKQPCDCYKCKALSSIFNGISLVFLREVEGGELFYVRHRDAGQKTHDFIAYEENDVELIAVTNQI